MLNEFAEVINRVVILTIPILSILFVIYIIRDTWYNKERNLKKSFCILGFVSLMISIIIHESMSTYLLATIWQEYEKNHTLDSYVKTFGYTMLDFFYVIVFLSCLFVLWYLYSHQIVPGSGDLKTRLKKYFKGEK